MAFVVGKDTYVSVANADLYWQNHLGGTLWADASTSDKEAALRTATQYIDKSFTWIGTHPQSESQELSWPRINAIDKNGRIRTGIPDEVKNATSYMAEQALSGNGVLNPQDRGGAIRMVKADTVQVEFDDNASSQPSYDYVDLLLKNIIKGGKGVRPLLKA